MGFPSPAQDFVEQRISLDQLFITRPHATYFMKSAESVPHWGILKDSLLVIDSERKPLDGSIVVAELEGQFKLCRFSLHPEPALQAMGTYKPIKRLVADDFTGEGTLIFGVVTSCCNDMSANEFDDSTPIPAPEPHRFTISIDDLIASQESKNTR